MEEEQDEKSLDNRIINWVSKNLIKSFGILILTIVTILLMVFVITALIFKDKTILNPNEIGDAIGGLTAPIIGLFSAFLVFIAFREQKKANDKLEEQNRYLNFENYSRFMENLNNELSYLNYKIINEKNGKEAIESFFKNNVYDKILHNYENSKKFIENIFKVDLLYSIAIEQLFRINSSDKIDSFEKKFLLFKLNSFNIKKDFLKIESEDENINIPIILADVFDNINKDEFKDWIRKTNNTKEIILKFQKIYSENH